MEQNKPEEAIPVLHEALAINPQDGIATELLNKALDETTILDGAAEEEAEDLVDFEQLLDQRKMEAHSRVNGRRNGKGKGVASESRGIGVLADEDKAESMMEMTDEE